MTDAVWGWARRGSAGNGSHNLGCLKKCLSNCSLVGSNGSFHASSPSSPLHPISATPVLLLEGLCSEPDPGKWLELNITFFFGRGYF